MFHITFVKFGHVKKTPKESQISQTEAESSNKKIRTVEAFSGSFTQDIHLTYVFFVSLHDFNCSSCLEDSISWRDCSLWMTNKVNIFYML